MTTRLMAPTGGAETPASRTGGSAARVYWTAFIGLFFDYYDLYLFIYLEHVLADAFGLTAGQSNFAQFCGLASVGAGALVFGFLADRYGRGRMMLVVFGFYLAGILGVSLAWNFESLVFFRIIASLALGAEWGISHTYLSERLPRRRRYLFAALLQFSILGGLLVVLMTRYALPHLGWRMLFALSLLPIVVLSIVRYRALAGADPVPLQKQVPVLAAVRRELAPFLFCFSLASLAIAIGVINVFVVKDLPQSLWYGAAFWLNVAPGMLLGAWIARKAGVRRALAIYAAGLIALSLGAYFSPWAWRSHAFALLIPVLNGIPFGLMGAYFNEVFGEYRTMLSGAAYNLGRILAGFSPAVIAALHLEQGGNYFLFTAAIGAVVLVMGLRAIRTNTLGE